MRSDVAPILIGMGHKPEVDFMAAQDGAEIKLRWMSAQPKPTEAEIDAAAPGVFAAIEAEQAKVVVEADARTSAKESISDLQAIIEAAKTPETVKLATVVKHFIIGTLGK